MEVIDQSDQPITANLFTEKNPGREGPGESPRCTITACPDKQHDLFAVAWQGCVSLWSSCPLRLHSTLRMTLKKKVEAIRWDSNAAGGSKEWRILQAKYEDSYTWDILIDADYQLSKLQKHWDAQSFPTPRRSCYAAAGNALLEVNERRQIQSTSLTRLLPPSMSTRQFVITLSEGRLVIRTEREPNDRDNTCIIQVSDLPIHTAVVNQEGDLIACRHGHGLTILHAVHSSPMTSTGAKGTAIQPTSPSGQASSAKWRVLNRILDESTLMTWCGQDMLIACSDDHTITFYVVDRVHAQLRRIHQQQTPFPVVWLDSSPPAYLIVLMRKEAGDLLSMLVYHLGFQDQSGNVLLPELVAERRVPRELLGSGTSGEPPLGNWQTSFTGKGQFCVLSPLGDLLFCQPNSPWTTVASDKSGPKCLKFFLCNDHLVKVLTSGQVELWDLRTLTMVSLIGEDRAAASSAACYWCFNAPMQLTCHSLTHQGIAHHLTSLLKWWLERGLLEPADLLVPLNATPQAIEKLILDALSSDRVTPNDDAETLLPVLYGIARQADPCNLIPFRAPLIRVLRAIDANSLCPTLFRCWNTDACSLFDGLVDEGHYWEALNVITLVPSHALEGRLQTLRELVKDHPFLSEQLMAFEERMQDFFENACE